jgi:hypothetical protein
MNNRNISENKRFVVGIIAAMMLIVVLFSSFYIAIESGHDCTGEDCPICSCIQQCENTLRSIGSGLSFYHLTFSPVLMILTLFVLAVPSVQLNTLVSQKVRLNN